MAGCVLGWIALFTTTKTLFCETAPVSSSSYSITLLPRQEHPLAYDIMSSDHVSSDGSVIVFGQQIEDHAFLRAR